MLGSEKCEKITLEQSQVKLMLLKHSCKPPLKFELEAATSLKLKEEQYFAIKLYLMQYSA